MAAGYASVTVNVTASNTINSIQWDDGSGNKIQGVLLRDVAGNNAVLDASGRFTTKLQDSGGNNITQGQKAMANSLPFALASDQPSIAVGGKKTQVSANFARPANTTLYTANQVVSNSTSATTLMDMVGVARVNGGSGNIVGIRLTTNLKSITPRFRVHLFNVNNPTVSGDGASHQAKYADESKRVAKIDLIAMSTPADTTNSDLSEVWDYTIHVPYVCAAGSADLFALLETEDGFQSASGQTFTLTLILDQD